MGIADAGLFGYVGAININMEDVFGEFHAILLRRALAIRRDGIVEQAESFLVLFSVLNASFLVHFE